MGGFDNRSKVGDECDGFVAVGNEIRGGFKAKGMWSFEGRSALEIKDPEKADNFLSLLLGENFLNEHQRGMLLQASRLPFAVLERAKSKLILPAIRTIEDMILGGGELLWADTNHNLLVDVGLTDILEKYFRGSAYTAAWYVGLTASSPTPAAGDTAASHAGWTENTTYSEGVRQTYSPAAASAKSISNSASKATFSINGSTTVGGAFLISNSTKGGTSGTLVSATAFSQGNRSLVNGDSLLVQSTYTQADDGI